ncbi:hypothetical protein E0485_22395, partial [Paenibacillus albiflavus]
MKRKRSISKSMLSFFLVLTLILQAVTFSATAYADSALGDFETAAVSESDSPDTTELPELEAVNDAQEELAAPVDAPVVMLAGPSDKTTVLMGANSTFPLEVKQGNAVIDPNGTIQGRQQFTLKSEGLKLPVNGDDDNPTNANPDLYIQKGDWIELKRGDYFKEVVLPTATKTLNAQTESGMKQLGTAYFSPNSIKIVFNGDDNFFNGVGRGIVFSFETTADADLTGMEYGDTKPINIFGTAYQLKNPDVTAAYNITLSSPGMIKWDQYSYRGLQPAQFVEGAITWESTVSAFDQFDNTIKLSLDGTKFFTDPASYNTGANVYGIYKPGSFKVNGFAVEPDVDADGKLSYIFPAGTGINPKVEFKTWIPKEAYYYEHKNPPGNLGRSYRVMFGRVHLKQIDDTVLVSAGQEISFAPDWIQKYGAVSKRGDDTLVTWTIDVNKNYHKQGLKNFTITDALPSGLIFESAAYQLWDTAKNNWSTTSTPIDPDEGTKSKYSFDTVNDAVRLVIVSKVESFSSGTNLARANWDLDTPTGDIQNNDAINGKYPATVSDDVTVTVGAHGITKSGSSTSGSDGKAYDYDIAAITWTVNVSPQYEDLNLAVYDLLRYDATFDINKVDLDENSKVSKQVLTEISKKLYGSTWQQYQVDSFKSNDELKLEVIPLTQGGKRVADLLKVTGYKDKPASFTFRSLMTNPNDFAGQYWSGQPYRFNSAYLFSDNTFLNNVNANTQVTSRMLNKEMLFASKPLKADGTLENVTLNSVNSYISNDSNEAWTIAAYDQVSKTVTFRLAVNIPGLKTEQMTGVNRVATDIKLVDTLPAGWEFVPFSAGKNYELYEGLRNLNNYGTQINSTVKVIEPTDPRHVVSFSAEDNVGTFSFTKLESPYVILVKARPSNAALEKYLEEYTTNGKAKQELYNKADLHMTWGGVEKTVTEQRKVIVPVQALGKSVTKPFPGVLEWTVNYYPPYNMENGVYLQDTLGAGMNLRKDESGKLVLTAPSMAIYRAKLTASGALERDGAALNLNDPNCEVQVKAEPGDNGTSVLKFTMKDPNQIYQFVYQTEVDTSKAKAGDKLGNEVKLMGDDKLKSVSAKSASTLDSSDVAGSSSSNALLPLKKVDPDGKPLQDVKFTLYKKSDGTKVAEGTTNSGGNLNLLFPDPGYYELKQTYIDTNTWLPTTKIYQVYVGNTPGKPIWVDGVKVTTTDPLVVPTPITGKLTISNEVKGNGGDKTKVFDFTITFGGEGKDESYPYTKSDGTNGMIKSGDTIHLKHGETVVIPRLPKDLVYTVTEADYTAPDGYATEPGSRSYTNKIVGNGDHKASFGNTRMVYGNLLVGNTVTGSGGDKNKEFDYKVTFADYGAGETYTYTKSDGTSGSIKSGDTIQLKHGQTVTIKLPEGLTYTIIQSDYTGEDYDTNPADLKSVGKIAEDITSEAKFVNHRDLPGGLLISNTVIGNGGDTEKEFIYTVTFTGVGANRTYSYTKSDGTSGSIKSNDKIKLKHGQTVTITGILKDTVYTVTEENYAMDGYTTDPTSRTHTGTIKENEIAQAPFENARYLPGTLALEPKIQKVPGDGKTSSVLTATLTGTDGKPVKGKEIVFKLADGTEIGKATTDKDGKAKISYTPPKLSDTTPKEYEIIATTTATSPSGVPYNEDKASVIAMPAALTGVLRDNTTGEVIPNAIINVKNVKTGEEQTITTDTEGKYYHPVQRDEEYTITYNKMIDIGGVLTSIPFTQRAIIESTDSTIEGNLIPAEITAVGIVLFKQSNGKTSLLNNIFAGNLHVYLKDTSGKYILENGKPKAFPLETNGTFSAEGLSEQIYTMEVRYEFEPGKELIITTAKLNVKATGELNISQELVDPYGIITDAKTGEVIKGAKVTLYYKDGTEVKLPAIPGFAPNDNDSPDQYSDANGAYAFMVFPNTDYYVVVTKDGYVTHKSEIISVGSEIVRYDVKLNRVSSGGNNGTGNGNNGTGNGNNGTGNGNNGTGNGNNGTDNGNPGTDNGNNGTGNGNNGTGNGNNGTGNGNNGTGNGNNGTGNGNNGTGNGNNGTGNGNN